MDVERPQSNNSFEGLRLASSICSTCNSSWPLPTEDGEHTSPCGHMTLTVRTMAKGTVAWH